MSHRTLSLLASILLLLTVFFTDFAFRLLFFFMVIYAAALLIYNHYYLKKHGLYTFWSWLKQGLFVAAIIAVYLTLPPGFLKALYLLFAAIMLFFFELGLSVVSEQLNFLQTLLTYFGLSIGLFALSFYFLPKTVVILTGIALMTFLVSRSSFDFVPQQENKKNYFSALLTFSIVEIGWVLSFLPFHFTAIAVILFNAFYVIWIVIYYYLYNNLSGKKIYFHILFSSLIIFLVLLSTPWK